MNKKPITILAHSANPPIAKICEILENQGHKTEVIRTIYGEELPDVSASSGMIIMGAPAAIYQHPDLNWLQKEIAWVEKSLKNNLPAFGICFGCQMFAHIGGGTVTKGLRAFEFGYTKVTQVAEDEIWGDELNGQQVFEAHGDTYSLPSTATQLMEGSLYHQQAAKFADNVYGTQFHPEVTPEIVRTWHQSSLDRGTEHSKSLKLTPEEHAKIAIEKQEIVHAWLEGILGRLFIPA